VVVADADPAGRVDAAVDLAVVAADGVAESALAAGIARDNAAPAPPAYGIPAPSVRCCKSVTRMS
jgi:hypothetical protein